MGRTRGQAALEFLTTYGWAFMVILVMIGALAYFGVINPTSFLPERCQLQGEFNCQDFQILSSSSTAKFYFLNNLGEGIKDIKFTAEVANSDSAVSCTLGKSILGAGESTEANCSGLTGLPAQGEKVKILLNGTYQLSTGRYSRPIQGEIFATVQ